MFKFFLLSYIEWIIIIPVIGRHIFDYFLQLLVFPRVYLSYPWSRLTQRPKDDVPSASGPETPKAAKISSTDFFLFVFCLSRSMVLSFLFEVSS